ncbi:MAG: SsrA-binding protein SmpB [Actinomycetota bacterium]
MKTVATNKKAFHDYFIEETYEAGMQLKGTEVKSLRAGRANLKDSFGRISGNEVFVLNLHISPYEQGNIANHEPTRERKLLLNKAEIGRLTGKVKERGYTLIPLKIYFKHGLAKVEIGLGKGKAQYDKRHTIAEKEARREMERAFKAKHQPKQKQRA